MCFRPSKVEKSDAIICPSCGTSNKADALVCEKCNTGIQDTGQESPLISAPQVPTVTAATIPGRHNLPRLAVDYPEFPGSSAMRTNVIGASINDGALWRFLKKGVVDRKDRIDCWYSSPVTALIKDSGTKAIVGVEIERNGKKMNIAARNGVVMALGGYENNSFYTQQSLDRPKVLPAGTLYNEGDGLAMAQTVGARFWHMNAWKIGGVGLVPEHDRVRSLGDNIEFFKSGSIILVGGDGLRYIAEDAEQRHGRVRLGGTWIIPVRPDKNFYIFDEAHRVAVQQRQIAKPFANWSNDLADEVESGKIVKASTLWGLAEALSLDASMLKATLDNFSAGAASGSDTWGRRPETMRAFGEGPYYGLTVFPSVLGTYGGPERTAKSEIVDLAGSPIPRLYSAGEFGGIAARNIQGGGSLSECIVFGKIAGEHAASKKEDLRDFSFGSSLHGAGSGDVSVYEEFPDESNFLENEWFGMGEGLGGPIWVKVSSDEESALSVEILRHSEHDEVGAAALDALVERMIELGTSKVDTVAGATVTSEGFKRAVEDALNKKR